MKRYQLVFLVLVYSILGDVGFGARRSRPTRKFVCVCAVCVRNESRPRQSSPARSKKKYHLVGYHFSGHSGTRHNNNCLYLYFSRRPESELKNLASRSSHQSALLISPPAPCFLHWHAPSAQRTRPARTPGEGRSCCAINFQGGRQEIIHFFLYLYCLLI